MIKFLAASAFQHSVLRSTYIPNVSLEGKILPVRDYFEKELSL